jgi:LysM repeat protein
MDRWKYPYLLSLLALIIILIPFGCAVPRTEPADAGGDIAAFVPPVAPAVQNEQAVIRIAPTAQQINVGDTVIVEIWVDDVFDLVAVDLELQFNPSVLQVQDYDSQKDGVQIEPEFFLAPDFVVDNQADNAAGRVMYALTQIDPTPPASGSGPLASVTFKAIAQGSTQLDFTKSQLVTIVDNNAQEIPVSRQSGQITVGQPSGEPTATFTPTATLAPGEAPPTPTLTPFPGLETATPTVEIATPTPLPPPPTVTPIPTNTPIPLPTNTPVPLGNLPPVKIPPGATYGFCYRVQAGDTIFSLGQKFGINPHFINLANDLNPPGYVFLHQALFIPEAYGQGPNVYRVKIGDTLAKIAEACHLPVDFVAQVNMLKPDDPLTLAAGDIATLQDGSVTVLAEDTIRVPVLIILLPPFAPPSRYGYPGSVNPPLPPGCGYYPCR